MAQSSENSAGKKRRMKKKTKQRADDILTVAGQDIRPGEVRTIDFDLAPLYTHSELAVPIHVIRGKRPGPRLFVSAAIHGDEINGVEIIRRVLKDITPGKLRGDLIAIPVVNIYGFINHARYLPDGRDLNRSFPGSPKGSLSGRVAHSFLNEIIDLCTHGIDLHTGARHRSNLPQIRANLSDEETLNLARAFGVPVLLDAKLRDGSLRAAAVERNVPILLYEAGEALRFDEVCIRAGYRGVMNVMRSLGMLAKSRRKPPQEPMIAEQSNWVRAPASGIMRAVIPLGGQTRKGDVLGVIANPLGDWEVEVKAPAEGIVIGRTFLPLVYEGDALFHIAWYRKRSDALLEQVESWQNILDPNEPSDDQQGSGEPPIV
ncbi:succinylglutamate desuccinylase/aspartoacylase [gamma proteobacterium HTCC5015]|nr:succinylglutamate desuccinylase/aspartoacylase [gamma proteobacterium HTCC5015]